MAVKLAAPFELNSSDPNFTRDRFNTREEMNAVTPAVMDEGHVSYCVEDRRHYEYTPEGWVVQGLDYEEITATETITIQRNSDRFREKVYYIHMGDTAYNIYGDTGVKWCDDEAPITKPNKTYVVSVMNNLAVWGEF